MRSISRVMFTFAFLVAVLMAGGLRLAGAGIDVWTSLNSGLTDTNVETLVIDPKTPTTLYVGTWYAGVFKSTNGGANWGASNAGLPGKAILAIVIDPVTPTTLYAGTWDGVFKSTDGGGHWSAVNAGWNGVPIYALAIDPLTPTTLYAGTRHGGVLKSTNGGGHWSAVNAGLTGYGYYVSALAIDPLTPTTLYAGTEGAAVFKSTNGGANWIAMDNGIPTSCSGESFAIDPLTPTTVYVGTGCSTGSGVFKSTNGGSNWNAVNSGMPAWYSVEAIAINPLTHATLYRGTGSGVFKSTNAGGNWSDFNTGLADHDVHALAIDPVYATTLYAGTLGGGVFAIELSPPLAAPRLTVTSNGTSFRANQLLEIDVTVANPGAPVAVDVYFGVVLPSAAGPGLGCPGGDAVAFMTPGLAGAQLTCLSAPPQSFLPLASEVTLPGELPSTALADFFTFMWGTAQPAGIYTFFLVLTPVGAFADGQIGPADLLAVGAQAITFVP